MSRAGEVLMKNVAKLMAIMLVVTACGGSDTESGETTTTTAAVQDGADQTTTTTPPAESDNGGGDIDEPDDAADVEVGSASVTIGGETYLFAETGIAVQCTADLFGVFTATLRMVDEDGAENDGGGFRVVLLHEGTDPDVVGQVNTAAIGIAALDQEWIADERDIELLELDPGSSQVDSHTVSGNTASGTATFYEENSYFAFAGGSGDSVAIAQGTFEVTCPTS